MLALSLYLGNLRDYCRKTARWSGGGFGNGIEEHVNVLVFMLRERERERVSEREREINGRQRCQLQTPIQLGEFGIYCSDVETRLFYFTSIIK
jgi:hypothetical protein